MSPYWKAPRVGLEPTTPRLTAVCSTIELSRIILGTYPQNQILKNCFYPFAFSLRSGSLCRSLRDSIRSGSLCCYFIHWKKRQLLLKIRQPLLTFLQVNPKSVLWLRIYLWLSPRPISIYQLNTLLCLHLKPIYLVVFKGSYNCEQVRIWDISSRGGLHA